MKKKTMKILAILLAVSLCAALTACASTSAEPEPAATEAPPTPEPTPTPTPEPTPEPEPETTAGFIRGSSADVYYAVLSRGDEVEYVGEAKNAEGYSIVKYGDVFGLIETRLLRLDSEADYEQWTGYCGGTRMLYEDIDMTVEIEKQAFNAEVTVIDEFENCYLVEAGDVTGFMAIKSVSKTRNVAHSGGGGGGSGGGQDGGDITLSADGRGDFEAVFLAVTVEQEGETSAGATVRVDGTKLLAGLFEYGDEVRVLGVYGDTVRIYIYKNEASADSRLVRLEADEAYQSWEGYAASNGWTYTSPDLIGKSAEKLKLNTVVEVLEQLDGCFLVRVDGELFYMAEDGVSETKVVVSHSGGGGGSGGDAGWTDPIL